MRNGDFEQRPSACPGRFARPSNASSVMLILLTAHCAPAASTDPVREVPADSSVSAAGAAGENSGGSGGDPAGNSSGNGGGAADTGPATAMEDASVDSQAMAGDGRAGSTAEAGTSVDSGMQVGSATSPTGLMCELTSHPEQTAITDSTPEFSWIVHALGSNENQTAYRILVASSPTLLAADTGDVWDSGVVKSSASVDVVYAGKALTPSTTYVWKVQTWDTNSTVSAWSAPQTFKMAAKLGTYSTPTPTIAQTTVSPNLVAAIGTGHYFFDFARDAFGWLELTLDAPADGAVLSVDMGEKAKGQAVDSNPGGSIRAWSAKVTLQKGLHTYRVMPPKDAAGVALPTSLGNVVPFRYAEVSNSPVALSADAARQTALSYPFDDSASAFDSSNSALNQVWGLCKYSIKATTFAGVYIDGDRERTPYEADAYIQALGHYTIDRDYALARYSHEYLMVNSTWPTEWKSHSVMLAWADWMYTGNSESLAQQYALLKKEKTLEQYVNADGLLETGTLRDIVDWPEAERDGYVLSNVNTVVNSFWCYTLGLMADMAGALGKTQDATTYRTMQTTAIAALNSKLFNASTGLYVDGQGSSHSALHANLFPLAFGLVPANRSASVLAFVKSRGMACSVYGAQYLLEALYRYGEADAALALLTATSDRGWLNMIKVGSTITMEAWDAKYKPNLDWNHAWGAAPANILPRYVLGVRPLTPGFSQAVIAPQPGSLKHIEGTVATVRGAIRVEVDTQPFALSVNIPVNMTAQVVVPSTAVGCTPLLDGHAAVLKTVSSVSGITIGSGQHKVSCQ